MIVKALSTRTLGLASVPASVWQSGHGLFPGARNSQHLNVKVFSNTENGSHDTQTNKGSRKSKS